MINSFIKSDYENDNHYHGNSISYGAFKGRCISVIDIGSQIGMGVYEVASTVYEEGVSAIRSMVSRDIKGTLKACISIICYTAIYVARRITLIALDILGIVLPEIGRFGRNIYKHGNRLNKDLALWVRDVEPNIPKYFKVLGLKENATLEEINKSYKKLAMKYHPDRPTGNTAKMSEITVANDGLRKNPHTFWEALKTTIIFYGNGLPSEL